MTQAPDDFDALHEATAAMLASRYPIALIREKLSEAFGGHELSRTEFDALLQRGRQIIRRSAMLSREEHRANGIAFLERLIANEQLPAETRLKANIELMKLTGASAEAKEQRTPEDIARLARAAIGKLDISVPWRD